jgi:hypothetical protein
LEPAFCICWGTRSTETGSWNKICIDKLRSKWILHYFPNTAVAVDEAQCFSIVGYV